MSEEPTFKGKDAAKTPNKIVAALHRTISTKPPVQHQPGVDHKMNELIERLEAKTTLEAKLRHLIIELQEGQPPAKGRAVIQLNVLLEHMNVPTQSLTEIWAEAKGCLTSPDVHVRQETLRLMALCIELQRDDLHAWQRATYYDIIQKHNVNVQELPFLEHALYTLIDEGRRNVAEVSGTLLDLLARWIGYCASTATGSTFDDSESGKQYRVAFFISERVFQYSYSKFEDQDVATFIEFLCNNIGHTTPMLDVIAKIIDILEIIPRYGGAVPIAAAPHIINFICTYVASRLTEQFFERFWEIMQSLLRLDHIAYKALTILENVPAQAPAPGTGRDFSPRHWQRFRIRGALIFLGRCIKVPEGEHKATLNLTKTLQSIEHAVRHADPAISQGALELVVEIVSTQSPDLIIRFTYEDWDIVWNLLSDLVDTHVEILRPKEDHHLETKSSRMSEEGRPEDLVGVNMRKLLEELVGILQDFCITDEYTGSIQRCVNFHIKLSKILPDVCDAFILEHYEKFHQCMPSNLNWLTECETVIETFIRDDTKPADIRLMAIGLITKIIPLVTLEDDKPSDDFFKRVVAPLLNILRKEMNGDVCNELVRLAVTVGESDNQQWALDVCKVLSICASESSPATRQQQQQQQGGRHTLKHRNSETTLSSFDTFLEPYAETNLVCVKGLVEIFEKSLQRDASQLSQRIFEDLVRLAQIATIETKVRLEAVDVLLRLRADTLYSIYIVETLARRAGRIPVIDIPRDSPSGLRTKPWLNSNIKSTAVNGSSVHAYVPTNRLKSFDDHISDDEDASDDEDVEDRNVLSLERSKYILQISKWLEAVITLLRSERSWELYYHLVEHFADQLSNKTFFTACNSTIIRLRDTVCTQLINSHLPDLDNFNNQKRTEVIMRLHKILTVLIGYHDNFVKQSRDELVRCFQINMGRYNPVLTKQCIHSLMVCCHELPKSIARCLSGILQTLSHQITNPALSVHILEFLVGVGRIPKIHGSFTGEEFMMVFQVALRYLQHSRAASKEKPALETSARMSQYITYLAFEALTVWFLAVKLENRRSHVGWIIRQLVLANDSSGLDDPALVFIDMLERFSFSDSPLKKYPDTQDPEGLAQYKKHWVVGRSVQTAQVVREDGLVKVTVRKPASMLVTYMQAEVDFDSDAIRAGRKVLTQAELNTLPSYMMTQMHTTDQPPLLLTEDEATLRSIRTLDYMPVVNFHTIGITYVGWGQTTEEEILSNETGSGDYQKFLEGIGTTVRLKGNTEIYHGGLDINEDLDGTHAYFWSDRTTQITFIVYTMIPLNKEGDRRLALSNKKRNAANCFVNIIWNESNEPYSLDTIASEFNSNSIVISRHSRSSSETDTIISSEISPTKEQFFKVKLVQTDGMPEVSPIMDEKIVSASSLAPFVRSVALKLSIFCQIYIGRRERSHWVARLDQIRQIADRALQKQNVISPPTAPRGALSPSISNATLSSMGRRVVSTETRTEGAASQRNEDDPLNQWMTKYDFSRYT